MNDVPCFIRPDGCLVFGPAVIEPWPSLKFVSSDPAFVPDEILSIDAEHPAWPFIAKIPYPLLSLAREVDGASWALLELVAAETEKGQEVLFDCPALAILITESVRGDAGDRPLALRAIVQQRWCEILRRLGLPATKRVLRILRKLSFGPCSRSSAVGLGLAIKRRHPHIRLLSHLPDITRDTVALLQRPPEESNAYLFLASSSSGGPGHDELPVSDCVAAVAGHLRRDDSNARWPYGRLNYECLRRILGLLRQWEANPAETSRPFPPPLVPGVSGRITPLVDADSVMLEGDQQVNCAASYLPQIESGECSLYAVTVLERSTLALRRIENGVVNVEGLQAAYNREASRETQSFVEAWLAAYNAKSNTSQP